MGSRSAGRGLPLGDRNQRSSGEFAGEPPHPRDWPQDPASREVDPGVGAPTGEASYGGHQLRRRKGGGRLPARGNASPAPSLWPYGPPVVCSGSGKGEGREWEGDTSGAEELPG